MSTDDSSSNTQTQGRTFQEPPVSRTGARLAQPEQNGQSAAGYPPQGQQQAAAQGQRNGSEQGNGVTQPQQQPQQQQAQGQAQGQQQGQGGNFPWGSPFPSLHLWPLNETFVMKMIHLPPGERVRPPFTA